MRAARTRWIALFALFLCRDLLADPSVGSDPQSFFSQTVHPLLQTKCFGCHGDDKKNIEGDFDMSTREGFLKGGESGKPAVIPGKPEESPIFRAVLRKDKLKMPPKDRNKLTGEEIEIIRKWIADGAVWAKEVSTNVSKWSYKEEDVWAFQPVKKVAIPNLPRPGSAKNGVDLFIQQKLLEKNLSPAPPADKRTLIRRATFDLTGLPPTSQEVEDFIKDSSTNAFAKVVDRLLASPHYGEQWARHWLDVVRYADTDGFSNDYERPNAWRYRDYVIRSFNTDKPYNDFVTEQIAGDELITTGTTRAEDGEKLIAVGMLRMGPWEQTAMSVAAVTRQQFLDDVTSTVGTTFCGLTVGCARCHDHKFDPIPTRDYYRLQSIFAPARFETAKVEFLPSENTQAFETKLAEVKAAKKALNGRISEITQKHDRAVKKFVQENGFKTLKEVPFEKRPQKALGLSPSDLSTEKVLRKRIEYREREMERYYPQSFGISNTSSDSTNDAPVVRILAGGALESPGEAVSPGVLSAVYHSDDTKDPTDWNTIPKSNVGRRLKLARWIASAENPLTARVMVNRIWQYHFGKGLVKSSNNFGKMGDRPTHPELLDWLANYFIQNGWSIKEMHRLIMNSGTYQQSANAADAESTRKNDPEDKLLSHFHPRRLSAEELRDNILATSGEISPTMGGPPVFPEINLEAALQPRHIMGSLAPVYVPSSKREERNRRTIYTVQIRGLINPMLQVFNAAPTDISCERRDETTVSPQVFALFNSQNTHDLSLAFAAKLATLEKNRGKQIEQLFSSAYQRPPTDAEKKRCLSHLKDLTDHHRKTKPADFRFPPKVEREMVEELTGEPFQFEEDWDLSHYEYHLQPGEVPPETRALAGLCLVIFNSNEFVYVY